MATTRTSTKPDSVVFRAASARSLRAKAAIRIVATVPVTHDTSKYYYSAYPLVDFSSFALGYMTAKGVCAREAQAEGFRFLNDSYANPGYTFPKKPWMDIVEFHVILDFEFQHLFHVGKYGIAELKQLCRDKLGGLGVFFDEVYPIAVGGRALHNGEYESDFKAAEDEP